MGAPYLLDLLSGEARSVAGICKPYYGARSCAAPALTHKKPPRSPIRCLR
jgi:hypothetical protein